nr:PREDICTED: multiple epidermal growth factor-like domains protein 8 [Latimeria chalumnae]|eukprot:XP_006014315.1 PREDICTED: multiple epidermal growth factor-like domains protein 8 [Latimeria chalumnae]
MGESPPSVPAGKCSLFCHLASVSSVRITGIVTPAVGCLLGNFSSQKGYPNCSAAIAETHGLPVIQPAQWSYGVCPDVDECRLQMASCHAFATCKNTFESFECNCNRGYSGDDVTYWNKT